MRSARTRPDYFIYMPWSQSESIPTMVSAGDCRARASEGLRFRCMERTCQLRGHTEDLTATPTSDQAEIPEDDLEVPDFLEQQDVQEDPDEEELPDAAKASSQGGMGMGWGGGVDVGDALRGLQGGLLAVCCKPCVFFDALW